MVSLLIPIDKDWQKGRTVKVFKYITTIYNWIDKNNLSILNIKLISNKIKVHIKYYVGFRIIFLKI